MTLTIRIGGYGPLAMGCIFSSLTCLCLPGSLVPAATTSEVEGWVQQGYAYATGKGVPEDDVKAVTWFRKAADAGNAEGMYALGCMYKHGDGVAKDSEASVQWYRNAAALGNKDALDEMQKLGVKPSDSAPQAITQYRKAAEAGDPSGMTNLGYMYKTGTGVPQDNVEAVKWYRKAADGGNAIGMNSLGVCYQQGYGATADPGQAAYWYGKAAKAGSADGMYNLGLCYQKGTGVPQDDAEAVSWFIKSATAGSADAKQALQSIASNPIAQSSNGVTNRPPTQTMTPQSAASSSSPPTSNDIDAWVLQGLAYANGEGVARSDDEAVNWFRKAADLGNADGMAHLGLMYFNGRGVPQSDKDAFEWLRKAANAGDALSMYYIGCMYRDARGVTKDTAEAAKWYQKAAAAGNELASEEVQTRTVVALKAAPTVDNATTTSSPVQPANDAGNNLASDQVQQQGAMPSTPTSTVDNATIASPPAAVTSSDQAEEWVRQGLADTGINGVPRNDEEAASLFQKAADAGNAEGMFRLGVMYEAGFGVRQDDAESERWYRKSAQAGNGDGMFAIGGNYEYGIHGVEKDIPTAIDWYRKAAAAGSGMAMNHLGKMYDEGTVVERDVSEAGTWYRKAASAGVDSAKQWLDQHTQAIVKISSYDNWGEQLADLNAVHDWQLSQVIHAADGGNLAAELRAHNDQASQYQAAAERAAVLKDSRNALTKDEFETTDQFNARCTQVDQNLQAAEAEALKLKTSLDASTVPQTRRAIEATLTLPVRLKVKTDVTYNADKQEFTGALSLFESGFIKDPVEDYKVSISIEGITQATPSLVVSGVPDVENARIIKQGLQDGLVLAGWASFTDEVSQTENSVLDRALLGPLFFTHHKISLKFVGKVTYQLQTLDGQSIVPSDIEQKLVIQVLDQ